MTAVAVYTLTSIRRLHACNRASGGGGHCCCRGQSSVTLRKWPRDGGRGRVGVLRLDCDAFAWAALIRVIAAAAAAGAVVVMVAAVVVAIDGRVRTDAADDGGFSRFNDRGRRRRRVRGGHHLVIQLVVVFHLDAMHWKVDN